jgi:hypothetical protein
MLQRSLALTALALGLIAGQARTAEADLTASLKKGDVTLKAAGAIAFGPQGILFIGDSAGAAVYAVDTGDRTAPAGGARPKVDGINEKIADLLGVKAGDVRIRDVAVNPASHNVYLSVARGQGRAATPVVLRLANNKLEEVALKDVKQAKASIPNAATGGRQEAITHLAYYKGRVLVAGQSNEEFSSKLRSIPFPFDETAKPQETGIEIYHGAHGKFETKSPIRVFTTYKIGDEDYLLAAYQCTPLVKIPVKQLKSGEKVKGVTVAELGNRNRPLSMLVYNKGGKDYVLMANNSRGLMKIQLDGVDKIESITSRVNGTAGLKYDTVEGMAGVQKIDAFDKDHALVLLKGKGGSLNLGTIELP